MAHAGHGHLPLVALALVAGPALAQPPDLVKKKGPPDRMPRRVSAWANAFADRAPIGQRGPKRKRNSDFCKWLIALDQYLRSGRR